MDVFFDIQSYYCLQFGGLRNAISFKEIDDDDIAFVENSVRKIGAALQKNLDESIHMECEVDQDNLIHTFGQVYASNPTKFCFQRGEKKLITQLVAHVKQIVDANGKNSGLSRFKFKAKKIKPKRRCIGLNITQKENSSNLANELIDNTKLNDINFTELKEKLCHKIENCLEQYSARKLIEYECVDRRLVTVEIDNNTGKIYGSVVCLICRAQNKKNQSPKRVSYYSSSEKKFWVISNYQKHLVNVHKLVPIKCDDYELNHTRKIDESKDEPDFITSNEKIAHVDATKTLVECNFESELKSDDALAIEKHEDESLICVFEEIKVQYGFDEKIVYTQLAKQITNIVTAVLENSDEQEQMQFKVNEKTMSNLSVANTKGDGNCLFYALTHQIHQYPINSSQHIKASEELRRNVVEYILADDNFDLFRYELQNRVYDIKLKSEIKDMATECKFFVRYVLARNGSYGGRETLLAVSKIYRVNIIIFCENGPYCMVSDNKDRYDETIAVAYRFSHTQETRNHYDSVADMKADDIYTVAATLCKQLKSDS